MLLLAFLWICWCVLHSLLISRRAHELAASMVGSGVRYYRLTYIIFSIFSLLPVLLYQFSLEQHFLFSWGGPWRVVQGFLLVYALLLFYLGARSYDIKYFLGVRQIRQENDDGMHFSRQGVLAYVRHPWYGGGLAFLWTYDGISDVSLLSRSILSLYLLIGTLLEERRLRDILGEPYRRYCREVPMYIPWRIFRSR